MKKVTPTSSRKSEHIRINLEEDVLSGITTGLEAYTFTHQALPEMDLEAVDLGSRIFGRPLRAPILISSMTGGTPEAAQINQTLAQAAQETGIALGLGSQRAAIEQPDLAPTFQVRQFAPDVLLFANLGAVQLNYGYALKHCQEAVEMIEADALILHFNALQEALQPEGDTRFSGLLNKIETICKQLPVPVVAKEVGWGFSEQTAQALFNAGIAAIDVAGAGGTSWSQVEMYRTEDPMQFQLAAAFKDWGIPTSESIIQVRRASAEGLIFASGGIKTGIDIAKCIALGASLGGMARQFLLAAEESEEALIRTINRIKRELQICMFAAGASNLSELGKTSLV